MSESVASEVVSAMVGGMFSASALYPLEVLKTRMQAETKGSAKKEEEEGDAEDGRILPNAQEGKNDNDDAAKTARSNAAASAAEDRAESASNTAMSAEEKAKSSKLALKSRYSAAASEGMGSYASLMYSNEGGVAPFYAGVVTSAVQSATEKALYFFAYTFLKNE